MHRSSLGALLVALALVQTAFSSLHVVGRRVLEEIPPLALAGTRVLLAAPLLVLWAWYRDRAPVPRSEWKILLLLGFLGIFANQALFLMGLARTTATSAALMMPSIPVFTAAAGTLLGVERLDRRRRWGILLASIGALCLLGPGGLEGGSRATLGNLLVLANCLSYSFFLVLQRPVLARLPWRSAIAGAFLGGSAFTLAAAGPELAATDWSRLSNATWFGIVWIGLVPTAGAFALNAWAVSRGGPALSAAFTTLQPVLTAVAAWWILGERLGSAQALGGLAIVAGLVLSLPGSGAQTDARPGGRPDSFDA